MLTSLTLDTERELTELVLISEDAVEPVERLERELEAEEVLAVEAVLHEDLERLGELEELEV